MAGRGRLLLVTFIGETRKVTGCRATPDKPKFFLNTWQKTRQFASAKSRQMPTLRYNPRFSATPTNTMSNETLQAVKGMNDILPDEAGLWLWFEEVVRDWLDSYGYRNIRMPLVEPTAR